MPSPIANVTLLNTFDDLRKVVNQLVVSVNDTDASSNLINVQSNTISLSVSANVAKRGVLYIDTNLTSTVSNTSVNVIASAASVNLVNQYRISGDANTVNTAGILANGAAAGANAYSISLSSATGIGANAYAQGVRNDAFGWFGQSQAYTNNKIAAIDISAVAVLKSNDANNYVNGVLSLPAVAANTANAGMIIRRKDSANGGGFHLEKPTSTSLFGNAVVEINTNSFRVYENGGTFRGITANLASSNGGASSVIVTDSNIGTHIAKNINEFPLNQDVRNTASPIFPNINVTGSFRKTGAGAGGFYDVYNQTGLLSVDAGYLRTNHISAPWYNSNKQVGMVVEGDLWFNSGFGTNAGRAYGCRAWGTYTPSSSSITTSAILATTTGSTTKTVNCTLTSTTCAALGISALGTTITLNSNIYYLFTTIVLAAAGNYTVYATGVNTFTFTVATTNEKATYNVTNFSTTINTTSFGSASLAGGNISSVSQVVGGGVSTLTVNFTNAMSDTNYAVVASPSGTASWAQVLAPYSSKSASSFNIYVNINLTSGTPIHFAVFR